MSKIIIIIILFLYTASFAQIHIQYEVKDNNQETSFNSLYLSKTKFAMKSDKNDRRIIFNGSENVLYVIDNSKKDYIEINKSDISKLAEKINQMNKMMEEQLSQVPENQRDQVKQMMEDRMPSAEPQDINYDYKKTNESDVINSYPATKYEVYLNGEKESQEFWITDYKNIDLKKEDFGAFLQFKQFVTEIFESIGNMADIDYAMFWDFNNLNGFPVRNVLLDEDNSIREINTLKSINRNYNKNDVFEVPSDYKKKSLNF